jgi:SGNH domain (fused to AT3 domains)
LYPGAAVLAGDAPTPAKAPTKPSPAAAPDDRADYETHKCQAVQTSSAVKVCTFGVTTAPALTVAVVGDSVAGQWMPALEQIAAKRKWRLVLMLHSRCPFTATMTVNSGESVPYTSCHTWAANALDTVLTKIKPAVVITSARPSIGTPDYNAHTAAALAQIGAGMATFWRTLIGHHIAVVAIQESPETGSDQPQCLTAHRGNPDKCQVPTKQAVISNAPTVVAAHQVPAASLVDMNSLICGSKTCSPIVGNVLVYRDTHHLTATYVRTMTPYLEEKLNKVPALR